MGLFRFWKGPDINQGLKQFEETPGAVLLDVRSPGEYRQGRLPGSQNLPLQAIDRIGQLASGKGTPLFIYCHSALMLVPYSITTYRSTWTPFSVVVTITPRRSLEAGSIFAIPSAAVGAAMPTTP